MPRINRRRPASLSILTLVAALACERDKQDSETTSGATTNTDETSSTGATATQTTGTALSDTTDFAQTTSSSSEPGDSSTTGSEQPAYCATQLTKEACNINNDPQGLGYSHCLWVDVVTWTVNTPCPDLAAGQGLCIEQDFTDDCSGNSSCTPERIFARRIDDDHYEAFAHPEACGAPIAHELCTGENTGPVCSCFGCQ